MTDIAERFVAGWVDEHVNTPPIRKVKPDVVEHLTCNLMAAAWESGLNRKQFLDAVEGDAYEFVLYEVEKASARSNSARRSPA